MQPVLVEAQASSGQRVELSVWSLVSGIVLFP